MQKPRLGHIQFINCLPLYYGLVKNDVLLDVDLVKANPKDLAVDLVAGEGISIETVASNNSVVITANGITSYGTNTTTILTISSNPALKLVRVDCTWTYPGRGVFTNSVSTCRAANQ